MSEENEISRLIRLKRHERPSEDYFEGFVKEFHSRQRSELLRGSTRGIFFERLATYTADFGGSRMLAGAGLACAAGIAVLVIRAGGEEVANAPTADGSMDRSMPFRVQPEKPLPLPEEIMPYPTDIYPAGVQKVNKEGDLLLLREF